MPNKLTTKEFVQRSLEKHQGKYSYSKTVVVDRNKPVIITCPKHGDFLQKPCYHISGHGCPICGKNASAVAKQSNTKEFVDKAILKHGNKYDYSHVVYVKAKEKVEIICPIHGVFYQSPCNHLSGKGCPECKTEIIKKYNHNKIDNTSFIKRAKEVHGNKYVYDKINYIKNNIKICITCPKHGDFWQTPNGHLQGQGCPTCGVENRNLPFHRTTKWFVENAIKIHGDKYDYSECNYVNGHEKVRIICKKHGAFEQTAYSHLQGQGCPLCNGNIPYNNETFVLTAMKRHGDKYLYTNVNYVNSHSLIDIICKKHGKFQQMAYKHLEGQGCPYCKQSYLENSLMLLLDREKIVYEKEKLFTDLGLFRYDYFLPKYKILIECQGEQHFLDIDFFNKKSSLLERISKDKIKFDYATNNNYKIFYLLPKNKINWKHPKYQSIYTSTNTFESIEDLLKTIKNSKNIL